MKLNFKRIGEYAVPESWSGIKDGCSFTADVKIVRSPELHRKFWKMIRIVLANLPEQYDFKTAETLKDELLFRAGYFQKFQTTSGETAYKVQSISYESLDNLQFSELYARVLDEGCKMIGVISEELESEIDSLN